MKTEIDIVIIVDVETEDELTEADAVKKAEETLKAANIDFGPPFYQSGCKRVSYNKITVFWEQ